jgi:4-hydroxy-3-polyprenylbenzoate decarboxylase
MKVHNVYHRKDAIWSFTVVGRPPQEDTSFGALIHEIAGSALPKEIHGLKEVNAVDAAGVHPLLFAIGSERYTPYLNERRPQEILTIANHILGKNQLSLAKYLFIAAREDDEHLDTHNLSGFMQHVLSRMDFKTDLHFHTHTTIDTLDYSGDGLNSGSKVVFAAAGPQKRILTSELPEDFAIPEPFSHFKVAIPGVITIKGSTYIDQAHAEQEMLALNYCLREQDLAGLALSVLCDDHEFTAANIDNLVWVTFTRSNPASDIHGVGSFTSNKHWGCTGPVIIDARKKPHHAPELIKDESVERNIERLGVKGASLYGLL